MADPILISDDRGMLDFGAIHAFLTASYWSPGVPRHIVERAAANSLCFGVYDASRGRSGSDPRPVQVGYARMVTDRATFAYLADVFVLEEYRGRGLSRRLMAHILAHPELQGLRRMMLMTRDAHGLYAKFGFRPLERPERAMERSAPNPYRTA